MTIEFDNDPKDRKRRFLIGLNVILGLGGWSGRDTRLGDANYDDRKITRGLANIYCLEISAEEIAKLRQEGVTSGEFTETYCPVIYDHRGHVDLDCVIRSSLSPEYSRPTIVLSEMDKMPKFGMNGSQWCDVATGPCSCGAWHD